MLAIAIGIDVWFVLNGRKIKARVADMDNKFAFYEEYKRLGLDTFGSSEDEKQVQEIAKKYNIEYDNIKGLISVIKNDYDRVIRMKKEAAENSD